MCENNYPLPDDVRNDKTVCSYIHHPIGNDSSLSPDYCHYVREPHPDDGDGLYHGEWKDITEDDRRKATIEKKKQLLEELEKTRNKIELELKTLERGKHHG